MFYQCLEDVFVRERGNFSNMPTNLLVSKMFSEDLCLEGSTSRKRYLSNAVCINQLNTEYCTLPEYLDLVTPDDSIPLGRCSLSEKTFSCIAATMVMNCGFDAGRVYRFLLKVTKYGEEVCDVESSDGVPSCNKQKDADKEYKPSDVYYGLVNRVGSIPKRYEHRDKVAEHVWLTLRNGETVKVKDLIVAEWIRHELDGIEVTTERPTVSPEDLRRNPSISEPIKGLLVYNYSGEEVVVYWRLPDDSLPLERVECKHLINSYLKMTMFDCALHYGYQEPQCASSSTEKLTPELIRDMDPDVPTDSTVEFEPNSDWISVLKKNSEEKEAWAPFFNMFWLSDNRWVREYNKEIFNTTPPYSCVPEIRYYDILHDKSTEWWRCPSIFSEQLRDDIKSVLFSHRTREQIFSIGSYHMTKLPEGTKLHFVQMHDTILHGLDFVTCMRVNECHPKGKGVVKCTIKPRVPEYFWEYAPVYAKPYPTVSEPTVTPLYKTEFQMPEGSGSFEHVPSDDSVTLLISESSDEVGMPESSEHTGGMPAGDEVIPVDISQLTEEFHSGESADINLLFVEQDSKDANNEQFASDIVHVTTVMDDLESGVSYRQLSDDEFKLMNDELFVLRAVTDENIEVEEVSGTEEILDNYLQ